MNRCKAWHGATSSFACRGADSCHILHLYGMATALCEECNAYVSTVRSIWSRSYTLAALAGTALACLLGCSAPDPLALAELAPCPTRGECSQDLQVQGGDDAPIEYACVRATLPIPGALTIDTPDNCEECPPLTQAPCVIAYPGDRVLAWTSEGYSPPIEYYGQRETCELVCSGGDS